MGKIWKKVEWDCCPECGESPIEVLTDCTLLDFVYDGDEARCPECGEKGVATVGQDTAWIDWHCEEITPDHELSFSYP